MKSIFLPIWDIFVCILIVRKVFQTKKNYNFDPLSSPYGVSKTCEIQQQLRIIIQRIQLNFYLSKVPQKLSIYSTQVNVS